MKRLLPVLVIAFTAGHLAAADFTVTNTNNSGPGSLFQAITDANNTAGADRVLFDIPGPGVHKIDVRNNLLPTILESLVIDGYSQPGAVPNSLPVGDNAVILIQVDGGGSFAPFSPCQGLMFSGSTSDHLVRGLSITGFCNGITASAIHSAVVTGNFIGILPDGETARPNGTGVGPVTQLGGSDPGARNIISGNSNVGFFGAGPGTPFPTVVRGNYIGTNASGTKPVPNGTGVAFLSPGPSCAGADNDLSQSIIGGTTPGAGNLISGNGTAIALGQAQCVRVNGLRIQGNLIGVQSNGTTALSNKRGILIDAGSDNLIGGLEPGAGNVIAFSDVGVAVSGITLATARNRILSNSIYANRMGIDLRFDGRTPNDSGDTDDGANHLQNYPIIHGTEISNGSVTIQGTLNSVANSQFTLQYFSESARPGQSFLGSSLVTTDSNGDAQFAAMFPLSDSNVSFNMTATSQDGDTSEFAQNAARLKNISSRVRVEGGDHVAIAGFIMPGPPLQLGQVGRVIIVRAMGPSLVGIDTPLPDPTLELYNPSGFRVASNDNWRDDFNATFIAGVGLAPANDLESALAEHVGGGNYTAVVRGNGGATGISVVEVYDVDSYAGGEVPNISTRGLVEKDDRVLIAGTILEQGAGFARIVARAIGPSLAAAGIPDPLANPVIELRDSQGAMIALNDDWRDGDATTLSAVGLAPIDDKESAIFAHLPSGAYTAIVRGKDGVTGVGLVELYNLH